MRLIPYEKYYLRSNYSPEEITSRMEEVTRESMGLKALLEGCSEKFIGRVEEYSFSTRPIIVFGRAISVVKGKIEPTISGSQITITIRANTNNFSQLVFMICLPILFLILPFTNFYKEPVIWRGYLLVVMIFAGLAIGIYTMIMLRYIVEAKDIKRILFYILNAQEIDPPLK
jgi:hypothetical protein